MMVAIQIVNLHKSDGMTEAFHAVQRQKEHEEHLSLRLSDLHESEAHDLGCDELEEVVELGNAEAKTEVEGDSQKRDADDAASLQRQQARERAVNEGRWFE